MSIIWDAVLGKTLSCDRDEWDAEARGEVETDEQDDEVISDPESITMKATIGSTAFKRARSTQSGNTLSTQSHHQTQNWSLSPESSELLSLFPILLSSSSAPILPLPQLSDPNATALSHRAGIPLLHRVLEFLQHFPSETNAHRPVLLGLNILLRELELNVIDTVTALGAKMFPLLIRYWTTRDMTLQEQVVIALRSLLPYVARKEVDLPSTQAGAASMGLVKGETMTVQLRDAMLELNALIVKDSGTRRGTSPLNLNFVCLTAETTATRLCLEDAAFPLKTSVIKVSRPSNGRSGCSVDSCCSAIVDRPPVLLQTA